MGCGSSRTRTKDVNTKTSPISLDLDHITDDLLRNYHLLIKKGIVFIDYPNLNKNQKYKEMEQIPLNGSVLVFNTYKGRELISKYLNDTNTIQKLKDNFQGTGYLLTDSHSKVIIVEHETGLEILYIAGSISSLIGLVPYVIKGWNIMRGFNNSRHYSRDLRNIEIRKLDDAGHLKEDHVHETIMHEDAFLPNSAFISATQNLESEILKFRKEINSLTNRIKTIEKNNTKTNSKRTINKQKLSKNVNKEKERSK